MKKRLLFIIPSLDAGGAEKSLVNLLNTIDSSRYHVDLFMFSDTGLFFPQLPGYVNLLPKNKSLQIFQNKLPKSMFRFAIGGQLTLMVSRLCFALRHRISPNQSIAEQRAWKYLSRAIEKLPGRYDTAIGFLEKSSAYFVVDKVEATKKVVFIHTYYSKLNADIQFDTSYFNKLDYLAVVSAECFEDLISNFPQLSTKVKVVPNIVSYRVIRKLSDEEINIMAPNSVISIGRLVALKGFDMAIEAARILKDQHIYFHWYIIGEGEERKHLQQLIKSNNIEHCFTLLGLKANPYPYIKQAKVFVQCSRYEGKSIAVDEAKILAKPILLTNFGTAKDQIEDGINGMIVEMNPEAIAVGIKKYLQDPALREDRARRLEAEMHGRDQEIGKFYALIHG